MLYRFGEEAMASRVSETGLDPRFEAGSMAVIGIPLEDEDDEIGGRTHRE